MLFRKHKQKKNEEESQKYTFNYVTKCDFKPLSLTDSSPKLLTYFVYISNPHYDLHLEKELFSIKLYNGEPNTNSDDFKKLVKYTNISKEDFEYEVREIILRELEKLEEQKAIENKEKEIINNLERYGQIIVKKGD